jgi:hypothetical protein
MKKPSDLEQLIEELENEIVESSVSAETKAKAVIHLENGDDGHGISLDKRECELLLHSQDTVNQLYEALGCPDEVTISLFNLTLDDDVISALERTFTAVDEL